VHSTKGDATKDLEAYLQLRSSQDILKSTAGGGGILKYNFKDIDEASPPQRILPERDCHKKSLSPTRKLADVKQPRV
jgi:hypothetical protein